MRFKLLSATLLVITACGGSVTEDGDGSGGNAGAGASAGSGAVDHGGAASGGGAPSGGGGQGAASGGTSPTMAGASGTAGAAQGGSPSSGGAGGAPPAKDEMLRNCHLTCDAAAELGCADSVDGYQECLGHCEIWFDQGFSDRCLAAFDDLGKCVVASGALYCDHTTKETMARCDPCRDLFHGVTSACEGVVTDCVP